MSNKKNWTAMQRLYKAKYGRARKNIKALSSIFCDMAVYGRCAYRITDGEIESVDIKEIQDE